MDVIGDVRTVEVRGEEEVAKAERQAGRGRVAFLMLVALAVLWLVAGGHLWAPAPRPLILILSAVSFTLFLQGFGALRTSHREKSRLIRYLQNSDRVARTELLARTDFIAAFRPTLSEVELVLKVAAHKVRAACEKQDSLLRAGLRALDRDLSSANPDPEVVGGELATLVDQVRGDLAREVAGTKAEFQRLRDLARSQGYKVYRSWIPYAGLPWKESVPVEGRRRGQ